MLLLTMVVHAEEMEELRNNSNSAVIVSSQNEEQISTQQNEQEEDFKMVGWTLAGLFLFGLFLMSVTLWNMHKEHDQELDNLRTVCLEFKTRAERAEKHYRDLEYLYDDLLKRNNDNVLLYNDLKDKYDKLVRESKTTARR
ncbi:MAG: hypothetical protein K6D97_08855 [Clostridia bacterium]|nr:hypothetical protein [Clostridia bacterium]